MEKLFDFEELEQAICRRYRESDVFEARLMGVMFKGERRPRNCSAFFTPLEYEKMQKELLKIEYYDNFWLSLNPVKSSLKKRADCKFKTRGNSPIQAGNDDVDRYRYLYIDFDVLKPIEHKENCTTIEEKRNAYKTVVEAKNFLKQYGFPDPFEISDSGNGFHMLYLCDLPSSYSGAIRTFLKALKYRFTNDAVKIDDMVFNAARMIRPPGSKNQKGKNLPDRPHRNACLIEENIPVQIEASLLEEFIGKSKWIEKIESGKVTNKCDLKIEEIVKKSGIHIVNMSNPAKSGSALVYKTKCPMCKSSDASAYICKFPEGFSYSCYHESCSATTAKFAKKFGIELDQVKSEDGESVALSDAFSSYRYSGQSKLKLPKMYKFEEGCVKMMDGKNSKDVISQPVYLGAILEDVDSGTEYTQISFLRHNRWRHHIVSKKDVLNRQRLIELGEFGLSVSSDNATSLTNYFRCFDRENENEMKYARASAKMGWQEIDGKPGFLWGQRYITKDGMGSNVDLASTQARDWPDDCIVFRSTSEGEQQLVDCLSTKGTFNDWKTSASWAAKHPNLLTMLLGSFSTPLLKILNQDNFVLDFCNRTSSGKTTGLVFAASIWGNPDKTEGGALIRSWDATKVSAERSAYGRNHLPMFLDDTKAAIDMELVSKIVYMLSNGQGRPRGNVVGTDRDKNFKTIVVSTGEDSITDFSPAGGLMARVLQVSGPMFTKTGKEFGFEISRNMEGVIENYGWAGPLFVSYLIENQEKWPEWRETHREKVKKMTTRNENILERLAKSMSVLSFCADLLREQGILDISEEDVSNALKQIWEKCRDNADGSDREMSALMCVCQQLELNQDRVLLVEDNCPIDIEKTLAADKGSVFASKINRGFIAKIETKGGKMVRLSVNNGFVERTLKENKYVPKAIKSQWAERGWLETRKGGSPTKSVKMGNKSTACCVVLNEKICEKIALYESESTLNKTPSRVLDEAKRDLALSDDWADDWATV